jgi:hypothetical protein
MILVDIIYINNLLAEKHRYLSKRILSKVVITQPLLENQTNSKIWEQVTNGLKDLDYLFKDTVLVQNSAHWLNKEMNLVFCSDGGAANNVAGYRLVGCLENQTIMTNKYKLPLIYNKYTSHQSEACGVLSAIMHVQAIVQYQKMKGIIKQQINALLLCDNETVTKTLNKTNYQRPSIKDFYSADYDIINEISKRRKYFIIME